MKAIKILILAILWYPTILFAQQSSGFIEYPNQHFISDTLTIIGNFDENPQNTFLNIGNQNFKAVKETSTEAKFVISNIDLGPTEGILREGNTSTPFYIQLLDLETSISKTNLRPGSKAKLKITVKGIQNSETDIHIKVTNYTPQFITLEGGEQQIWTIPANSTADKDTKQLKVKAIRIGGFDIKVDISEIVKKISEVAEPISENQSKKDQEAADEGDIDKDKTDIEDKTDGEVKTDAEDKTDGEDKTDVEEKTDVEGKPDEETDKDEETACGSIYGKIKIKGGKKFRNIVVFVEGKCDFCPPKKPLDSITITNDCFKYVPLWVVIPEGTVVTVKNTAKFDCYIASYLLPKLSDKSGFDEVIHPNKEESFVAKTYIETLGGNPTAYVLMDHIHKLADMRIFIAPNACYSEVDEDGNYEIGELPTGSYNLRIYTRPLRSKAPRATVIVKANERVRQDFLLVKRQKNKKEN